MNILLESMGIHTSGGGRSVAINLFRELFQQSPENTYTIILNKTEPQLAYPNVRQMVIPIKNRFLARIVLQVLLPFLAPRFNLVHFTKNLGAALIFRPQVVTVHDMTTLIVPQIFSRLDVLYWRYIEKHTLRAAQRVITISQDAANDLSRIYDLPGEKIEVIYHGRTREISPATPAEIERVHQAYSISGPYLVCVGNIHPKKNLSTIVKGFAEFKRRREFSGKLVLVGTMHKTTPDNRLEPVIRELGLENDVFLTGEVPDADIAPLYSGAFCSLFASLHEGFGLVALEALSCGAPLITARSGAVGEVVGDAAVVLDDPSPENIATALAELWDHPEKREEMIQKGLHRAAGFSWQKAAAQTLAVYRKCIQKS